ncbi:hypothetical protein EJA72_12390 [Pseudomonas sp. PB120]|uniref:hypothetical protein n=1 Tax=Pseudomonas sp. PB120 TaxID=2494700 RepID=UPI0012FD3AFB|nr:hypothetical protein [Pseudomonas sp. PB120]MVV49034.1 hypothetical protein [Pseudomonas sp. PB120]
MPYFDFATEFEADYDANDSFAWEVTELEDPLGLFEDIYRLVGEECEGDLQKASLEDQSGW